jgi:hypothetical protein
MKKIILALTLTFFLTISSKAQSNLEFSRAVKEKFSYTSTTSVNTTLIVPTGKVLKITSATVPPGSSNLSSANATIDGQYVASSIAERSNTYQYGTFVPNMIPLPLWLPAGTYAIVAWGTNAGTFSYSGIEFNIVP